MRPGCERGMANADSEVKTLLNFVSLASSDIKAALDRSAPCRRSVDHRKYLQKQLRRFSARGPAARHTACAGSTLAGARTGGHEREDARPGHVPMRKRQLPASFWKEPQSKSETDTGESRSAGAGFHELKAQPPDPLSGGAQPQRRSVACACPLQYGICLLQHGHAPPFRSKTSESGAERPHTFLGGLHGSGAHVVIKPIPTKPVAASSIFSVFGFV